MWGYGHYFVFASVAAIWAGIQVMIDRVVLGESFSPSDAATVTVPIAVFIFAVWVLLVLPLKQPVTNVVLPVLSGLVGMAAFLPWPLFGVAILVMVAAASVSAALRLSRRGLPQHCQV